MFKGSLKLVAILFFAMPVFAGPSKMTPPPLNCKLSQVYLKDLAVYLNKKKPSKIPQVYLINNPSAFTVLIDHTKLSAGAGAGWASSIAPGHWSAIAVSSINFNLRCKVVSKDKPYQASCGFLKICEPSHYLTAPKKGDYWVAEDQSWEGLVKELKQKDVHVSQ